MEISEGVTPEILDAWPIERGLTLFSFSLPSVQHRAAAGRGLPGTDAYLNHDGL